MKTILFKNQFSSEKIVYNIKNRINYELTIEHLYNKYFLSVKKIVLELDGTYEDAEDIFQDALAKVIWSIDETKFQGKSHISTYLITISKNMWLKTLIKKNKLSTSSLYEKNIEEYQEEKKLLDEIPFGNTDDMYLKTLFEDLLNQIGIDCQNILKKYYFENKSYDQILYEQKDKYSSEQALRNKKSRCVKYLKKGLEGKIEDKNALLGIISSCM